MADQERKKRKAEPEEECSAAWLKFIFSDHRIALQRVVVEWLGSVMAQKAK
jgi:hypothetical protein